MNNKVIIGSALLLALGIILGGQQIGKGISSMQEAQRTVYVKGLSEKEVPANRITWPIFYKEVDNNLVSVYNKIERNNAKIVAFLKEKGVKENEIIISSPDIIDNQAERYMSKDQMSYRYNGTSIITVASDRVDQIRPLISQVSELIKDGIAISTNRQYEHPVRYDFTGLNDIKPTMIAEATQNARISAESFAKDSESKLGKIKTASQGQMSIFDRDENSPHIKILRVVTSITYYLKD